MNEDAKYVGFVTGIIPPNPSLGGRSQHVEIVFDHPPSQEQIAQTQAIILTFPGVSVVEVTNRNDEESNSIHAYVKADDAKVVEDRIIVPIEQLFLEKKVPQAIFLRHANTSAPSTYKGCTIGYVTKPGRHDAAALRVNLAFYFMGDELTPEQIKCLEDHVGKTYVTSPAGTQSSPIYCLEYKNLNMPDNEAWTRALRITDLLRERSAMELILEKNGLVYPPPDVIAHDHEPEGNPGKPYPGPRPNRGGPGY